MDQIIIVFVRKKGFSHSPSDVNDIHIIKCQKIWDCWFVSQRKSNRTSCYWSVDVQVSESDMV